MTELNYLPATEIAKLVVAKKVSPVEVVQAHLTVERGEKIGHVLLTPL